MLGAIYRNNYNSNWLIWYINFTMSNKKSVRNSDLFLFMYLYILRQNKLIYKINDGLTFLKLS